MAVALDSVTTLDAPTVFVPTLTLAVTESVSTLATANPGLISSVASLETVATTDAAAPELVDNAAAKTDAVLTTDAPALFVPYLTITTSENIVAGTVGLISNRSPVLSAVGAEYGVLVLAGGLGSRTIVPGDRATLDLLYRWTQSRGYVAPVTPGTPLSTPQRPSQQGVVTEGGRAPLVPSGG